MQRQMWLLAAACLLFQAVDRVATAFPDPELIGYWPLATDGQDHSGHGRHAVVKGAVQFNAIGPAGEKTSAITLDGASGFLEIPTAADWSLGTQDFSVSLWMRPDETAQGAGDLISQYDVRRQRGFLLGIKTQSVTTSVANAGHLQFGIDSGVASEWTDCGRPGDALLAFALTVHRGSLYAGTCEPGAAQSGRVYRYGGGQEWVDCGAPDKSNSVTSLAVHRGELYAGTGKYRVAGSALTESENTNLGGRIFRYAGDRQWIDCGALPNTEAIGGLVVFRGELYASSLYRPAGFYRYDGQTGWIDCGTPDGKRVVALGVYHGQLYATSYDGGRVYRYDGSTWTDCGLLGDNTQTYSFATYFGRWYVGTWPSGKVYRFEDVDRWTDVGRLGDELEVMGMLVHNGRLLAGTLPLAEVYAYDGEATWKKLMRLDHTPDVKYRRAWTMAEHDGRVYCSTLPSGRIYAFQAGHSIDHGHPLTPGWRHVAAVRAGNTLTMYVDGQVVSESAAADEKPLDLRVDTPLRIGFGANDYFHGSLSEVRLYGAALTSEHVRTLAQPR
ncbi:MAG: LamG-like jellyroll fold domain-containing protein [Planctomycetaceae bacterium]|nr:LamG-like jellyroll fold domain-containing protein [Planctomycetaceae bacterium]